MVIRAVSGQQEVIIQNSFPQEAKSNAMFSFVIFALALGVILPFMSFIAASVGDFSIALCIPLIGVGVFVTSFLGSGSGPVLDIEIDQDRGVITYGDKELALASATFTYRSRRYNNPITESRFDGELMEVTIQSGYDVHSFRMRVDTFLELKDILKDNLGISMRRAQ